MKHNEPTKRRKERKQKLNKLNEDLMKYEMKRWQEQRGKFVEFDIKTMKKYEVYYNEMCEINPDGEEGMGVEQLKEPFISLGLANSKEDVTNLIESVDDDNSGRIEFAEFLRIIHNKSKKKEKGNEKITTFFKNLANNNVSKEHDLNSFSFKTSMNILRRDNLLKAFLGESEEERYEGAKMLKAYSSLLEEIKNIELIKNEKSNENEGKDGKEGKERKSTKENNKSISKSVIKESNENSDVD